MKICVLTSGHDVFDNRIYYKEILSLKKKYDEIYLIAPGDGDFTTEDGIMVKTFQKRKTWYDRVGPMKRIYKAAYEIKADVYHAHEPDSFQVALKLKKNLGAKVIFDSHEYHPEGFAEHFPVGRKVITKILKVYEKLMVSKGDYVISVNDILVDKFKKQNKNVELIPNYPVIKDICEKNENQVPTFIYVGGLKEDRGIMKILYAISKVKKPYNYYFVGNFATKDFQENVMEYCENNITVGNVIFTGKIPHKEVFKYLSISHAGFVVLQPENWRYVNSEPIKLFEYMMSRTAVIASDFPMMKSIIEEGQVGIDVEPTSVDHIAQAIERLGENIEITEEYGDNGFNLINEKYNWSLCEEKLLKVYDTLLS